MVKITVEAGAELEFEWLPAWGGLESIGGQIFGDDLNGIFLVPTYDEIQTRVLLESLAYRIYLSRDGGYSLPPSMFMPDALVLCAMSPCGNKAIPLQSVLPGHSVSLEVGSVSLYWSGDSSSTYGKVNYVIENADYARAFGTGALRFSCHWDLSRPCRLGPLPLGTTKVVVSVDDKEYPKTIDQSQIVRGTLELQFP